MSNEAEPLVLETDVMASAERLRAASRRLLAECGKVIVGQADVLEQLVLAILARGHCLLVGVPGLAKTLMIRTLSEGLDLAFSRVQFTPDLMPSDITGTELLQSDPTTGSLLSSATCSQVGKSLTSLVGFGYRLDRRNDYLNATRGFYVDLNQDLAGLGGDVNYIRTEADGGWYHGFTKSLVFSLTGSAGYVQGWGGDSVRINDRFYKGGVNFRGFQTAGIGPRDLSLQRSDALGGKAYAIGTTELTIPTFLPDQYGIKAALFADFGTLGLLDKRDLNYRSGDLDCLNPTIPDPTDPTKVIGNPAVPGTRNACIRDDLSLRASAGLTIFWKSPMGPIQFDFSRVLAKEAYDKKETFRFSTSTRF